MGTCSSVEILKGYTVRKKLGKPAQAGFTFCNHFPSVQYTVIGSVILVFLVWFQWLDLGYLFIKEYIFSVTKIYAMSSKTKKHSPNL